VMHPAPGEAFEKLDATLLHAQAATADVEV
jgi:hypothetical protein